jgi:general stress protein 26
MVETEAIRKLIDEADAVYLATVEGTRPHIRALLNLRRRDLYPRAGEFCRRERGALYFATSAASAKVRELRANHAAAAYYCGPGSVRGVSVAGEMEVLAEPELKRTLWEDAWSIYWTGPDDPDYVVLRMKPSNAAGWWGTAPFEADSGCL